MRGGIIRGAGPGFSAGADVTDFAYDPISLLIEGEFKPFLSRIYEGRKIYIAQVHGNVAGISVALAMTCDFMVMSEDASVYLAFAALGLVPDGGVSWNLLHALGRQRALHAIIEGQKIGAARCLDFGIAAKVVAPETLAEETAVWAERLAEAAPLAAAAAKRVLSGGARSGFVEAIGIEAQEQNQLVKTADFQRGLAAFAKRERPEFRGD
jgi:2-(1,2-epoxy-1,2-dihydrophenyl)acetyl-CoA isomerase